MRTILTALGLVALTTTAQAERSDSRMFIACFDSIETIEATPEAGGALSPIYSETVNEYGFELHITQTPMGRMAYIYNPGLQLPYCVFWSRLDPQA